MDGPGDIVERARQWVGQDQRVLGAFVHGSVARGDATPLSDLDLIVVAYPGRRDELWAERDRISRALLGAPVVEAHEVPHQRPYRWQARTSDLRMLDLALDEGAIEMWRGLSGPVQCLLDRGDLRHQRAAWVAASSPPIYNVKEEDGQTWGILCWLAGSLLHGRAFLVHRGIVDLIGNRIVPVADPDGYSLGTAADDAALMKQLERALPHSLERAELARSLLQTARLYQDLVADWARRTGGDAPSSPLAGPVVDALTRLVAGRGERLKGPFLHPPGVQRDA